MTAFLVSLGLNETLAQVVIALIAANLLIGLMLVSAIFSVWLERKVSGRIQDRLGPTRVGGKFGWLQTLADGLKLLVKEDIVPAPADSMLFRIGPYIALVGSYAAFIALPFSPGIVAYNMNVGVFFILAVMSAEVFGIILGAYGSGSKWALFGGIRESAQVVGYEVPRAVSIVVPIIVTGSMNLVDIAAQQEGLFWNWLVFRDPFTFCAFWTFFTCGTASCKRAPFDLAEAESELVAGFHTEYSGFRWLIFFMAEYGSMVLISGVAVIMFLGGWHIGFLPELSKLGGDLLGKTGIVIGSVLNVIIFLTKCYLMVFVMMWVRWTLPRLRIDQVMMMCLKYVLPISCALLLLVCLWRLMVPTVVQQWFKVPLAVITVFLFLEMLRRAATTKHRMPVRDVPNLWKMGAPALEAAKK